MKIRKSIQKLIPRGIEVTLQGESTKSGHVKISIKKQFDTTCEANEWFAEKKDNIRRSLAQVESSIGSKCK